ncbi:hypothetical protein [Bradyrhizobium sp. WSM2254]|nr:hypothetical protein [Bradyrhizobium sp. WSM2254]
MAKRIITVLTPITTAKKQTTAIRTKRPVIGRMADEEIVMSGFL